MSTEFDPKSVLQLDPWLVDCVDSIGHRYRLFKKWKDTIEQSEGGYDQFSKGYLKFGLNVASDCTVTYREWAPNAKEAVLIGDFSELYSM
jgi:1,4-alpha-glucan branching enzyme